jgi:ParB-like chromosome segregation protein Spo0J
MKISDIKKAVYNPRKIEPENLARLCKSITDFSDTLTDGQEFRLPDPIIINKRTGNLVGGHQRLTALEKLGQDFVDDKDIRYVDCDEKKEMALNIALNNQNLAGEYDFPKLKDCIIFLDDGDFKIDMTGFNELEIKEMFDFQKPEIKEQEPKEKTMKKCPSCGYEYY